MTTTEYVIDINGLCNQLGDNVIHKGLDLQIKRGEIMAIVGGSGSGKTTLLRSILMLLPPRGGTVKVFGTDVWRCSEEEGLAVRRRWGMLFQRSALFSSLTVLENIMFPLQEFTALEKPFIRELAKFKLALVGLPLEAGNKFPSELSGGMLKRAAAARALALDPELLFLDEPTAGLDPRSAEELDTLMLRLRDALGLTIVIVSHDLDSLRRVTDRVAFLGEGKVLAVQPLFELQTNSHPLIQDYFSSTLVR